jgi:alpha/beta superfamily hydrolase
MRIDEETVRFRAGGPTLEGRLAAGERPAAAAVLCHPHPQYGGDMENAVVQALAAGLAAAGVATLRFNFRGVGASEGRFDGGSGEVDDARAAVAFLRTRVAAPALALVGYSFGAVVALAAGRDRTTGVTRLVAVAPPLAMVDLGFLAGCATPLLFVVGERDTYCPPPLLERALALPAAAPRVARIAAADHFFGGYETVVAVPVIHFLANDQSA